MGISLSHARYEEIKQIVVDLFVKYGVSCVPVNSFELATKMGIKVIPYSAISESKRCLLLKKSKDGFTVEKNGVHDHIKSLHVHFYLNGERSKRPTVLHPGDVLYEKHEKLFKGVE